MRVDVDDDDAVVADDDVKIEPLDALFSSTSTELVSICC